MTHRRRSRRFPRNLSIAQEGGGLCRAVLALKVETKLPGSRDRGCRRGWWIPRLSGFREQRSRFARFYPASFIVAACHQDCWKATPLCSQTLAQFDAAHFGQVMRGQIAALLGQAEILGLKVPEKIRKINWADTDHGLKAADLLAIEGWSEKMREPIPVRRAWGLIGLFWFLLIETLEDHLRFGSCRRCGRFLKQTTKRKVFCGPGENVGCYRDRRAATRRKSRNSSGGSREAAGQK
jgi:hypothetical protein